MFEISNDYTIEWLSKFYETDEKLTGLLQEECAELIQAISKYNRKNKNGLNMVKEEMAHVAICLSLTSVALNISKEDIDYEVQKKSNEYNMIHNNIR